MSIEAKFLDFYLPLKVPTSDTEVKLRLEFISFALPEYFEELQKCIRTDKKNNSKTAAIKMFDAFELSSADLLILWATYDLNYSDASEIAAYLKNYARDGRLEIIKAFLIGCEKPKLRAKMAVLECLAYLIGPTAILKLVGISDVYLGDAQFAELLLATRNAKASDDEVRNKKSKNMFAAISSSLRIDTRKGKKAYNRFSEARFLHFLLKETIPLVRERVITIDEFKVGCSKLKIELDDHTVRQLQGNKLKKGDLILEMLIKGEYINSESAYWDQTKIYGGLSSTQWIELLLASLIHENFFLTPLLRSPKMWESLPIVTVSSHFWRESREIASITKDSALLFFIGDEALNARKLKSKRSNQARTIPQNS